MPDYSRSSEPLVSARRHIDPCRLTKRERELIEAYAVHGSYEGVCKALGLKRASISDRFGLIRSKLGVASNEAAVLAAKGE